MTSTGLSSVVSIIDRQAQAARENSAAPIPQTIELASARRALMVGGLVFDMAGVLYEGTVCQRSLWQLLLRLGVQTDYERFCETWEGEYLDEVNRGARSYEEAQHAFLRSLGLCAAHVEEVQAASHIRGGELESGVRPLPGVCATMAKLASSGFRLAVLANSWCPAEALRNMLDRLGLSTFIPVVLSSCDLGATKPAAECYHTTLSTMGIAARQTIYVGREPRSLAGATKVGMQTVAFNYVPGAKADRYIQRFDELAELVQLPPVGQSGSRHDRTAA